MPATRCPICDAESPAHRIGPSTVINCSSCGEFAYDRQCAAALRLTPALHAPALSHIETATRVWTDRIARFVWQQDAGLNGPVGFAWMEREPVRLGHQGTTGRGE